MPLISRAEVCMHRAKSPLLILKSIHLAGTKHWDKPFFCNRGAVDGLTRQALNTPGLKARGRNKRGMNLVDGGLGNKTVALRGSSGCFYYPRKIAVGNKMSILVNHYKPFISSYSPSLSWYIRTCTPLLSEWNVGSWTGRPHVLIASCISQSARWLMIWLKNNWPMRLNGDDGNDFEQYTCFVPQKFVVLTCSLVLDAFHLHQARLVRDWF